MYILNVHSHFSAAHFLRGYAGACKNLHGHNWKVRVSVKAPRVNEIGMVLDFTIIKGILNDALAGLDHVLLNDLESFIKINPTSENIARYLYGVIAEKLQGTGCVLHETEVWESENSSVIYQND